MFSQFFIVRHHRPVGSASMTVHISMTILKKKLLILYLARTSGTILEETLRSYQITLRYLLLTENILIVASEELSYFWQVFKSSVFTCRYRKYHIFSVGFKNETIRDHHEEERHTILLCTISGCKYPLPFSSPQRLKTHMVKAHPLNVVKNRPRKLRYLLETYSYLLETYSRVRF